VGKIHQQTVIDANSSHVFAKLYLSKVPMTAVDVLHDRVLPFYDEHHVEIEHLLTDNGRECCGRPVGHPFELYSAIRQIEHRRTDIGSPETDGFCEQLPSHGEGRVLRRGLPQNVLYESLEQLQRDLDDYVAFYNRERAHQGYRTQGRTPFRTLSEGVAQMRREDVKPEAA
jgi:hypothetical protein